MQFALKSDIIYSLWNRMQGGANMPNIKSAKKRVLIAESNYARNKQYRTAMKTAIKKADKAIAENSADKEEVVKAAVKKIDQMACKGIIHKNNAARKKSSLVIRLAKAN